MDSNKQYNLNDTDFVGNIQCIVIWSQPNIGFLRAIRPAKTEQIQLVYKLLTV